MFAVPFGPPPARAARPSARVQPYRDLRREGLVGGPCSRVMRAVQHVLVCYASCVRLAPPPHTRMPPVGATSAPARIGRSGNPRCSEEVNPRPNPNPNLGLTLT